jgi:hypothetical protein
MLSPASNCLAQEHGSHIAFNWFLPADRIDEVEPKESLQESQPQSVERSVAPRPWTLSGFYALVPCFGLLLGLILSGPPMGLIGAASGIALVSFYDARTRGSWTSLPWGMGAAITALCASWLMSRGPL